MKSRYRKFKIKTVEGQDDFAMLAEVARRYFKLLTQEKKPYPDLVLVDGGKGQLSSVMQTLNKLGMKNQQAAALAKRLDEIYLPNKSVPLMIPKGSVSLKLLQRIRDEAHRFAVQYHRTLRKIDTIKSELDRIPGIGPKRRRVLIKQFGSIEQIKQTSMLELSKTDGINQKIAERIYKYFHSYE